MSPRLYKSWQISYRDEKRMYMMQKRKRIIFSGHLDRLKIFKKRTIIISFLTFSVRGTLRSGSIKCHSRDVMR